MLADKQVLAVGKLLAWEQRRSAQRRALQPEGNRALVLKHRQQVQGNNKAPAGTDLVLGSNKDPAGTDRDKFQYTYDRRAD